MSGFQLDFAGKVAIVTGGASGIGQEAAVAFAELGARVVVADRVYPEETLQRIADLGGISAGVMADVSVAVDQERITRTALHTFGRLDVAFNNAGIGVVGVPLLDQTEDDFDRIIAVDLKGVYLGMRSQIPAMISTGGGSIVNTGSVASLITDPGSSIYTAAKHGVAGLSKGAALDYASEGVRVNVVAPGFTATPLTQALRDDVTTNEMITSFNAYGRAANPREVVAVVMFLASDLASFVTGAIYPVDAGQTAH